MTPPSFPMVFLTGAVFGFAVAYFIALLSWDGHERCRHCHNHHIRNHRIDHNNSRRTSL